MEGCSSQFKGNEIINEGQARIRKMILSSCYAIGLAQAGHIPTRM